MQGLCNVVVENVNSQVFFRDSVHATVWEIENTTKAEKDSKGLIPEPRPSEGPKFIMEGNFPVDENYQ